MKNKLFKGVFYLCIAAAPLYARAQSKHVLPQANRLKTNVQQLPLNPLVRVGKLSNGFTYYIQKNAEPKDRVLLYLANKVGSILETDEQQGIAHFLEHMNFNGTTHYPKNELVSYLQSVGVRFGADLNAYTSFDETVYMLPIPSVKPEIFASGMQIMRDWAQGALLETDEIDKERGVILEEKRLGQGAQQRMRNIYMPVILNGSRYATRLPIGQESVLNAFTPGVIRSFYKDWYRPDLQALIVVGDVDVNATEAMIKKMFTDLKSPAVEKSRTRYTLPLTGKNQFLVVTDKEFPQTVAQVHFKHHGDVIQTSEDYRKKIIEGLLNQMLAVRLGELVKVADPPFVSAGATNQNLVGDLDAFTAYVVAKPGQLERGFKAIWTALLSVEKFGFTSGEMERAKTTYLKQMELQWMEKNKTPSANFVNEYLRLFLKGEASPGIDIEYQLTKQYLPAVQLKDIDQLFSTYLTERDRDIIIMAPEKDKKILPDEQTVNEWISSVEGSKITAYQDDAIKADLMPLKPSPGKVVSEKQLDKINITELVLSNGVKVILKPTTFNNNQISFFSFSPGGTSLISNDDYQSAANATSILASSGLGQFNAMQLPKILNGKAAAAMPYISERTEGISGSAAPADLETALQMTHLYFTAPRKDTVIFKSFISRAKSALANRENDPTSMFNDTISAVLNNYNTRRTGPNVSKLGQINLDKAYTIYRDRFADASDFTFFFVGNFEVEKIKPLLERYLASLPALRRKEEARDLGIHIPDGEISKVVSKGTENKSTVLMVLSGKYEYGASNNLELDALKEVVTFKMLERLRETEGGVYTPSVRVNYIKYPESRYAFLISFGCAPANREKLIAAAQEELKNIRENGPSASDLQKFIAEEKNSTEAALKTNNFWLGYLSNQYQNKESLDVIFEHQDQLERLTTDRLKAAAMKYLNERNLITFSLLPEK
jgi:zinc protease